MAGRDYEKAEPRVIFPVESTKRRGIIRPFCRLARDVDKVEKRRAHGSVTRGNSYGKSAWALISRQGFAGRLVVSVALGETNPH